MVPSVQVRRLHTTTCQDVVTGVNTTGACLGYLVKAAAVEA